MQELLVNLCCCECRTRKHYLIVFRGGAGCFLPVAYVSVYVCLFIQKVIRSRGWNTTLFDGFRKSSISSGEVQSALFCCFAKRFFSIAWLMPSIFVLNWKKRRAKCERDKFVMTSNFFWMWYHQLCLHFQSRENWFILSISISIRTFAAVIFLVFHVEPVIEICVSRLLELRLTKRFVYKRVNF